MTIKSILSSVAVLPAAAGVMGTTMAVSADETTNNRKPAGAVNDEAGVCGAGDKFEKKSDVHINISEGFLSLDKVPDMNFGTAARSAKAQSFDLVNNEGLIADDGDNQGQLVVTDSRGYSDDPANDVDPTTLPWSLFATMDNFKNLNTGDESTNTGWAVALLQKQVANTEDKFPELLQPTLTPGQEELVMHANVNQGTGTSTALYKKDVDAKLTMPANEVAGNWDAQITWRLQAEVPSAGSVAGA